MTPDTDVAILGGGCAGLSLAVALAQQAPHLRVVTLEERASYTRDRTWCFWADTARAAEPADDPFRAGVTHQWNQWRVQAQGRQALQCSSRFVYRHLPADNFYRIAQERIGSSPLQELLLDTRCDEVEREGDLCRVRTSRGDLRARWVFDARTPAPGAVKPVLWQRFTGWHVCTAEPCFSPECVDLMDFQPAGQPGRTTFFYVLPFSSREALVEVTYLDAPALAPEEGRTRLQQRLESICGGAGFEVLYEESGALPMGQSSAGKAQGPAIAIGTRGGRVKASSGYAFARIQRQSRALAGALARGLPIPSRFESPLYATLDDVFLAALRRHPERTSAYFLRLFSNVPPDLLVPFLSETASARAIVSTMLALPARDFLAAALQPRFREVTP